MTLFIKINFYLIKIIIEIDVHEINYIKSKRETYYAKLNILKILCRNKYFLFFKINFIYVKHIKNYK